MCYLISRFLLWLVDCERATVLAVPIIFSLVVESGAASPSDAVFDQEEGQFYQGPDRRTHESMLGNPLTEAVPAADGSFCFKRTVPCLRFQHKMHMSICGHVIKLVSWLSLDSHTTKRPCCPTRVELYTAPLHRPAFTHHFTCLAALTTFKIWFSMTRVVLSSF